MSNPRTSRRGSRPSSVAPAATFRRIGSGRISPRGPRFTRPCGSVRIRSSTWKFFRVTRRRVRPEKLPDIHGSSSRPEADSRSTVIAGSGVTVPRAESFAAKTGPPFARKDDSPDPPNARIPPSPGVRLNRNPIDRKYSLGHGHAEPGVRQREVLDVEQALERRQVRWRLPSPGGAGARKLPPSLPRAAATDRRGRSGRGSVRIADGPGAGDRPRPKGGPRSRGRKVRRSEG